MIEYYLKFTSEAEATAVLYTAVDELQSNPNYANISTIGIISKPTGEVDSEGTPVMAIQEGWHVNVKTSEAVELEQYQIFPVAPMRVWAS